MKNQISYPAEFHAAGPVTLLGIELMKIRRSKISLILALPALMMWIPSAFHADVNFTMDAYHVLPEYNYFIQGYMGMSWFMIPASLIICAVLLTQTECSHNALLKARSLPVSAAGICSAKFLTMVLLTAEQLIMSVITYYASAALASRLYEYDFLLPLPYVLRAASLIYLAALPAAALFLMLAVLIRTPVFSVGIGLASVVPSVLMLNTKLWYCYPPDYPFYMLMTEYGRIAPEVFTTQVRLVPLLPVALSVTVFCLTIACLRYGAGERGSV